jgi:hypothetical protein
MEGTLFSASNTMSPFANQPELWLSGHLERQKLNEMAVKIQAVARGFLNRRRSAQASAEDIEDYITIIVNKLKPPTTKVTVPEFLRKHGLDTWADKCPDVKSALTKRAANKERHECLWHAKNCLRLAGKAELVAELEWCNYHEESEAMFAIHYNEQPEESLWTKLTKYILG